MKVVVFIDVQNDFVTGPLGSKWAQRVTPDIIRFAKACRSKGYALYATADTHKATVYDDYGKNPGERKVVSGYLMTLEGERLPTEHCIEGTDGHKIVEGLVKDENRDVIIQQSHIIDKRTFGSYLLADRIENDFPEKQCVLGIAKGYGETLDEIIVCGFCTSICVSANAQLLRARFPNVPITVVNNLCADIDEKSHWSALRVMTNCQMDIKDWNAEDGSFTDAVIPLCLCE